LQSELEQCKADLAVCGATTDQEQLFVQVAGSCHFERTDGMYTLHVTDVDPATYTLNGRPWSSVSNIATSFFVTYVFDRVFNSTLHQVAISFHGKNDYDFSGPIISTMIGAAEMNVPSNRTRRKNSGVWYKYQLNQSPTQQTASPLEELFGGFINDSVNAVSSTYTQCVIMIADPIPSEPLLATRRDLNRGNRNSFSSNIYNSDSASDSLEAIADTIEGLDVEGSKLDRWASYKTFHGFGEGKPVDPKDVISQTSSAVRALAQTVRSCTRSCDARTVLEGVGSVVLSLSMIAGVAFPVVGAVLNLVGLVATITAMFLPSAQTSFIPPLTSYDVQNAVENAISRYSTAQSTFEFEAIRAFAEIDVDLFKEVINHLGYIRTTEGANAQKLVDEQIGFWFFQWSSVWTNTLRDVQKLEAEYKNRLGKGIGSVREKIAEWDKTCQTSCGIYPGNDGVISDGNNRLTQCHKRVLEAGDNLSDLLAFSNAYMSAAFKLWDMVSAVSQSFSKHPIAGKISYPPTAGGGSMPWSISRRCSK